MRRLATLAVVAVSLVLTAPAAASELVARDAANVSIKVDARDRAVVYYTIGAKKLHPVFWGAIDARHPSPDVPQVAFRKDYSGGWKAFRRPLWKTIKNVCRPYAGPPLAWFVTGCTMPNGSHWALQSWQRALPIFGREPRTAIQNAWELRLSHWSGEPATLEVWQDWIYSVRLENLVARLTYRGQPVFGFKATRVGVPLDAYGRNVYVDALNSSYGPGWRRANGLLTHQGTGLMCMAFAGADFLPGEPNVNRGRGERYRATVIGPGVTPDVAWEGAALPPFDAGNPEHVALDAEVNALVESLGETDARCTTD